MAFNQQASADAAGGPRNPTLLTTRGRILQEDANSLKPAAAFKTSVTPVPQVFGVAFGDSSDVEDDPDDQDLETSLPIPPIRNSSPSKNAKDEEFWSKATEALAERSRREALLSFLKKNGFRDVNSKAGWFFNYRYPLHEAVEQNDVEMVRLLLQNKAKMKLKDANGLTARQLARHKNLTGSYNAVLQVLTEYAIARKQRNAQRRAAKEALAAGLSVISSVSEKVSKPSSSSTDGI